jgi:hypothetical protein
MDRKTISLACKRRRGVEDECAEDIDHGPDLVSLSPLSSVLHLVPAVWHAISGALPFRAPSTSAAAWPPPPYSIGLDARLASSQGHLTTEDLR